MTISLNGSLSMANMVTLTNVPNILKITNDVEDKNSKAVLSISSLANINENTTYSISLDGYVVYSSIYRNEIGKKFYITQDTSYNSLLYVCDTIVNALNSISYINSNYNVYISNTSEIHIDKRNGESIVLETTLPNSNVEIVNGVSKDGMSVVVNVYHNNEFVATLQKNVVGSETSFNLSPILATFTPYGSIEEYNLKIYTINGTKVGNRFTIGELYSVQGYLVNQGQTTLNLANDVLFAQNVSRGETKTVYNNTTLYTYYPQIDFTLYSKFVEEVEVEISYSNGYSESKTIQIEGIRTDVQIVLNSNYKRCQYVDITIGETTIRYNVIQPLKYTSEIQRIYWYNSYGGISFMDFVGERTEQRKTTVDTYNGNLYNFHVGRRERAKVYNKQVDITATVSTHYIDKDGTWAVFDLQNSRCAWTTINGVEYSIIVNDVKLTESTNGNDVYKAEITYNYSLGDTL